jgi:Family of unknown function (DUF6256)
MSSSLIRQDLGPMVVSYVLVMGSLAIGLRIVQRSGKAAAKTDGKRPATDAKRPATDAKRPATDAKRPAGQPKPPPASTSVPAPTKAQAPGRPGPETGRPGPETGRVTARARLRAIVRPEPGWRRLAIFCLSTAVGGYLLLMAVLTAYYYGVGVAHGGNFVQSGFSGCALLLGLAAPVFIVLSWLTVRKGWRL